ncbi:hypothetical protein C481_03262 [Natrialba asiatica DSM 12278]|uniref:Uncharacterized protein n=1 Tax=Natrialba asiatica (strain ATCC 700177 / DSM 12278 / JCM 9576 / FERM P-10747 / NBRC 102637 / 172P1) TaxID=29540 RepID=M0B5L1_NATA1|nr:hypothetical protein C481_03262 [Natrialba asiatica DSM 12278]
MGSRTTYTCTCSTCGYHREFLEKSKAKRARNYHKYEKSRHTVNVGLSVVQSASTFKKLQYWTYECSYEFERNYTWWMWFYQFL